MLQFAAGGGFGDLLDETFGLDPGGLATEQIPRSCLDLLCKATVCIRRLPMRPQGRDQAEIGETYRNVAESTKLLNHVCSLKV